MVTITATTTAPTVCDVLYRTRSHVRFGHRRVSDTYHDVVSGNYISLYLHHA